MMNVFMDTGYVSLNKFNEKLCGDRVFMESNDDTTTLVLSDGLGSGVKANILSTLTGKILSTMVSNNIKIDDCIATVAQTLPVCKVRQIAYSTFSVLQVNHWGQARLIEFDNPKAIFIRNGKSIDYESMQTKIHGKKIFESKFNLKIGDTFILMSDGVIHAGVGETLNFGWLRDDVVSYLEERYDEKASARTIASMLCQACNDLYMDKPGDDTTAAVLKVKQRNVVNLMIGPPKEKSDDEKVMNLFFSKEGKKIVCGGTTAQIVSQHLDKPIEVDNSYIDHDVPPGAKIEGVDLVTEGIITIGKVLEYADAYLSRTNLSTSWCDKNDSASKIATMLFEQATDINFFVGRAVNPAHQNPDLPINFNIKISLIDTLKEKVEKMGKIVKVFYY